ncbi:hypothetical protein [Paraferrimonas sp. SM1919]|uniref:hypothetical protein n=1 Tax=Paraferrimonas sp. SM1919 TaxID=2662263 RepID=UPI0013D1A0A0|nr:hypothetical protein [Paraferrimonas sp. SM1919]
MKFNVYFLFGYSPRPKVHLFIAILFACISGILAIYLFLQAQEKLSLSTLTKGVVIDSQVTSRGFYAPEIEYLYDGVNTKTFVSSLSSSEQSYFKGDEVDVLIDSKNSKPMLFNFFTLYGLTAFAGLFSVISWLGSLGIYVLRVRNIRAPI